MTIMNKISGTVCLMIGAGILYFEYIVLCAIGALGSWIANLIGATGGAHTGVIVLSYIPVIGIIILILIGAGSIIAFGIGLIRE